MKPTLNRPMPVPGAVDPRVPVDVARTIAQVAEGDRLVRTTETVERGDGTTVKRRTAWRRRQMSMGAPRADGAEVTNGAGWYWWVWIEEERGDAIADPLDPADPRWIVADGPWWVES